MLDITRSIPRNKFVCKIGLQDNFVLYLLANFLITLTEGDTVIFYGTNNINIEAAFKTIPIPVSMK